MHEEITLCEAGWRQNKDTLATYGALYNYNPIFGYSKNGGLVCRNPFYESFQLKTGNPRIHYSAGGCGGPLKCPCLITDKSSNSYLTEAEKKKGVLEKGWIHITNALGGPLGDGRCDNPNIRNEHPVSCAGPWATSFVGEHVSKIWGTAAQKAAIERQCKPT